MLHPDALRLFLTAKDYTARSAQWYETTLATFNAWLETRQVAHVEDIRAVHVREYFAHLRTAPTKTGKPLASATTHNTAAGIIAYLNWMRTEDVAHEQVLKNVKKPVLEKKLKGTLTPEHVAALLRAAKNDRHAARGMRDTALLCLLLDTGARANELVTLRLRDLTITRDSGWLLVRGKGRREREVGPLSRDTRLAVQRWMHLHRARLARAGSEPDAPLFIAVGGTGAGQPLTVNGLRLILEDLGERAKLPQHVPVNPHAFRHSFAYHYMQQPGADVLKLSRLMGHASLATTEKYLMGFGAREARSGNSVLDSLRRGA